MDIGPIIGYTRRAFCKEEKIMDKGMERDGWRMGTFLAGFFVGGLMGVATTLLAAPQSGEETRTMIRDTGLELRDKGVEVKDGAVHAAEERWGQAEQAIAETRSRMVKAVDGASGRVEDLTHTIGDLARTAGIRREEAARPGQDDNQ
jgi:gas vesicle protein